MKQIVKSTAVVAVLIAGIIGLAILINNKTHAQLECSGAVPTGDSIHFEPSSPTREMISRSTAIQIAISNSSTDVSSALATNAQFVLFSDDARGTANAPGDDSSIVLDYQNVPAWVVTFCGVTPPVFLPFDAGDPRMKSPIATAHTNEWNIVIDGRTGAVMEEYTFR